MNLLAPLEGPYAALIKWGVALLLLTALWGHGWVKGNEHGTAKLTAWQGQEAVSGMKLRLAREIVVDRVVTKYVKIKGETQIVTKYVNQEVSNYAQNNTGTCLDAEWRRVHDDATRSAVPAGQGGSGTAGEGRAPGAAAALDTVTENYAACNRNADRLDALIELVNGLNNVKP